MEKPKRWQFYLILAVVLLTFYNILPTLFYYAQPLKKPIGEKEAHKVASKIIHRVNSLEDFTTSWLQSQSENLKVKPKKIELSPSNPRTATITFKDPKEAELFARTLPRAGSLIPFTPAELSFDPRSFKSGDTEVTALRKIGLHLDPKESLTLFHFIPKEKEGAVAPEYRSLVFDRLSEVALHFAGPSKNGQFLALALNNRSVAEEEPIYAIAKEIVDYENSFGEANPITKRYFASFTAVDVPAEKKKEMISLLDEKLTAFDQETGKKINELKSEEESLKREGKFLDTPQQQSLEVLTIQKNRLEKAKAILAKNRSLFESGSTPLTKEKILATLEKDFSAKERSESLKLDNLNPFVSEIRIDWNKENVDLLLYPELVTIRKAHASEIEAITQERANQLLYGEIAAASRSTNEKISPSLDHFTFNLVELTKSSSLLAMDLSAVAQRQIDTLIPLFDKCWTFSGELAKTEFPLYTTPQFEALPKDQQKFGLVFYAPLLEKNPTPGFKSSSIYAIGKGMGALIKKYQKLAPGKEREAFEKDFRDLTLLFRENGFIGYFATDANLPSEFRSDFIFELDDFSSYLIAASRENFTITGAKKYALLEFTDVEQRLLTQNKIDIATQEDLLRWKDEYNSAKVSIDPSARLYVPAPSKSPMLNNVKLSALLYFRGDERKIIRWGLDLSGGKTVRIGLKDQSGHSITNENDLKQAIDELYLRVNKLGVSEVGIRREGSTIVLDFPGSQGFSASDLVKASAMYFHVANEKFSSNNALLAEAVNTFLEEVWNEAVITNRKDIDNINLIAWQHLGGDPEHPEEFHPLTVHGKLLYDQGLRIAYPKNSLRTSSFNDTVSAVSIFRGNSPTDWQGQSHPLLFIFNNYALEGANLTNIQTGYDPSEGNVLSFSVRSAYTKEGHHFSPRDDFYNWTSQFSEEKIAGTPKENYSRGRGWRMAVILNGSVVSSPTLNATLRDSARITGHFTQREINQLASDLKAGSLSFTPYILSEENVSPDLGREQRIQGISAAFLALVLVIATMVIYYRFGGVVASCAVIFNLFIIWAVLQNLNAALTLPGLAGIILAVAMSVDANVLVFERIREEYNVSKKIASTIYAGYRKAFSAIFDSSLTTLIAAIILLNFDSGPIKGFALTLIIGIVSSMFTALFMTRYFFSGWIQDPRHTELKMMRLFEKTNFNFLNKVKPTLFISGILIVGGLMLFAMGRKTILGMDFTGGYALTVDLVESSADTNYRARATHALEKAGLSSHDFQIRELTRPNELRLQLSSSLDLKGKPFYGITGGSKVQAPLFLYQANPRITWIVSSLEKEGLQLNPASLPELHLHWTEMSGQLSNAMRNQAIIGLTLALIAILIYITFRFEFNYGISATLGLIHDILLTLALFGLIHLIYPGMVIDMQVIAALMTIIGYSLNDTIIVFDRVREEIKLHRKENFADIVNGALNTTLSRTMMTSGITILALLALVLFGGSTLFNFSLIMLIGVGLGTLSSLYIATPLLLYFHNRDQKRSTQRIEHV